MTLTYSDDWASWSSQDDAWDDLRLSDVGHLVMAQSCVNVLFPFATFSLIRMCFSSESRKFRSLSTMSLGRPDLASQIDALSVPQPLASSQGTRETVDATSPGKFDEITKDARIRRGHATGIIISTSMATAISSFLNGMIVVCLPKTAADVHLSRNTLLW